MRGLDSCPPSFQVPHRALRQPIALNLFKWMVLGDRHIPGRHQAAMVQRAMSEAGADRYMAGRSWRQWFGKPPRQARRDAIGVLDEHAARMHLPLWTLDAVEVGSRFFLDLVEGGLSASLMEPIAMRQPELALMRRALDYEPRSRLHLHIDSIECAALSEGIGDAPWDLVKATAAKRVLELIHSRWSPRHGTVYSELTPDLDLRWRAADADERQQIRKQYRRFKPDLFEDQLKKAPHPDWSVVDVEADIAPRHVHRLLLALAGDGNFLVADRLHVWALDLVSAGLAMHALAWTDRYATHGRHISPEVIHWAAFETTFFSQEPDDAVMDTMAPVFRVNKTEFTSVAAENLCRARESYWELLRMLHVERESLGALVSRCWQVRPIVYHG